MVGWLWRMLIGRFGCEHHWAIMRGPIKVLSPDELYAHDDYYLQCDECGNLKRKRL